MGQILIGNVMINQWIIRFPWFSPTFLKFQKKQNLAFNCIPNIWFAPPPISSLTHLPPCGELQIVRVVAVLTPSAKALRNSG